MKVRSCISYKYAALDSFETFVSEIAKRHGNSKVQIIAHSMGGLITFALLNKRPGMIHSAIFAGKFYKRSQSSGVPFGQGIGFLKDLHIGTSTGFNSKILGPEILFTFPSLYNFFPFKDNHKIFEDKDKPLNINLFDALVYLVFLTKECRTGSNISWDLSILNNPMKRCFLI